MSVPTPIATPPDSSLVLLLHARGFQIYVCGPEGWVLKGPEALLYDQQGSVIGKHFAGPTWQHDDSSQITAKLAARVDSPDPTAIPWLLLNVSGHSGEGIFSRITTVQRINTAGGLPPASPCAGSNQNAEFKSLYTADYYFYATRG